MAAEARLAALLLAAAPAAAGAMDGLVFWGVQVEQFEGRFGEEGETFAWDADAFVGADELKLLLRSEAEYAFEEDGFETLETQLRLQRPISDFFDAVAGVRLDAPTDGPERVYGVLGVHGLAPQWFEIDADLFVGEHPSARFEAEYEALITNRVILVPSVEIDLPLNDDAELDRGAFAPEIEIGARLSYDLVDRLLSPYVGAHYERAFGESAARARDEGEDDDALFFVVGARLVF